MMDSAGLRVMVAAQEVSEKARKDSDVRRLFSLANTLRRGTQFDFNRDDMADLLDRAGEVIALKNFSTAR
jgi:hypothetical protein